MNLIKKFSVLFAFIISGILLVPATSYAQGYMMGNNGNNWCYNSYSNNNNNLTKEQRNQLNKIRQKYDEKITPLQQKLNDLGNDAPNFGNGNKADISKIKQYHKQIRELCGKIDDLRLDESAEINKVIPKGQRGNYNNYYQCYGYNRGNMMRGYGMMGNNGRGGRMYGRMGSMMGGHGMGGMMNGYGNNNK